MLSAAGHWALCTHGCAPSLWGLQYAPHRGIPLCTCGVQAARVKVTQSLLQVAHHVEALREVHGSYEMSGEATDFQALLSRRVEQLAAEQP
mgnify:CR=1 FL=1